MTKPHLLLVDDDRHVLESMTDWLRGQGFELDASPGYADALERLRERNVRARAGRRAACATATASICSSNAGATGLARRSSS